MHPTSTFDPAHVDPPLFVSITPAPSPLAHRDLRDGDYWRAIPAYADTTAAEFGDHKWQQRHTVTNPRQLRETLGSLVPESFYEDLAAGIAAAPMALRISPHLLALVDWSEPLADPIRTQFLPLRSQQQPNHPMLQLDSLHEQEDSPVPGLTHRYPDKALFLPQDSCPVYCRFCTRSYAVGNDTPEVEKLKLHASVARWEEAFAYIASKPQLEDIVISGGDSYNLRAEHLELIGLRLLSMPNIRRLRFAYKGALRSSAEDPFGRTLVGRAQPRGLSAPEECTRTFAFTPTLITRTRSWAGPRARWSAWSNAGFTCGIKAYSSER
jgi:lysine 2,3-aminomutase